MLNPVVNGVLMPSELADAPSAQQEAYAANAKRSNAAFIRAYHELDDQARTLGFASIEELADA